MSLKSIGIDLHDGVLRRKGLKSSSIGLRAHLEATIDVSYRVLRLYERVPIATKCQFLYLPTILSFPTVQGY